MNEMQVHQVGRHEITLALRDGVGPVSPYSQLLAENIPDLSGMSVVDVGSGSGFIAIVARLQGAKRVYLLETYDAAIALAFENAERNNVRDGLIQLPIGSTMIPLPPGETVDAILSNPAQLPLSSPERANSPFYAGPDGRSMIDGIISDAPRRLARSGFLLLTHNSLANLPKTMATLESAGMQPVVVAERLIEFRPFIDREWLDKLGGAAAGLYVVQKDVAYERLYVIKAQRRAM